METRSSPPEARRLSPSQVLVLMLALGQSPGDADEAPAATAPPSGEEELAPPTPSAPVPYQPSSIRPFEMAPAMPSAPVPYSPAANDRIPDAPVTVDAYRRNYEGPPDATEAAYDGGVRRNFNAQQVRMGPLDGAWTVRTRSGAAFMMLQLHDPGRAGAEIEGAWRSLPRPGQGARSGFLVSVAREGQTLVLRWYDRDETGNLSVMRLIPGADGRWTGHIEDRDVEIPVTMGR